MRCLLVICGALVGASLLPAAATAQGASMIVTPNSGLTAPGQMVQVTITGLPAGDSYVVQTARGPGFSYCNGMAALLNFPGGFPYSNSFFARTPLTPGLGSPACANLGMPSEVPCLTDPDAGLECLIEARRADGSVIASAPIDFEAPENRPPVAVADRWTVTAGNTINVPPPGVLRNDSDPDGDPITARVRSISFASSEWTGLRANGSFGYRAGPGTRRRLNKTITYVAVDSHGAESAPTQAVVVVEPKNHAPVTGCDEYRVRPRGTLRVPARGVLANDTDPDGDPLTAVLTWTTFPRTWIELNADGSFTFKAGAQRRHATFRYAARDTFGAVSTGTVRLGIGLAPGNCAPSGETKGATSRSFYRAVLKKIECKKAAGDTVRARVTYNMWVENEDGTTPPADGSAGYLVNSMRAKARMVPRGSTTGNHLRSFGQEAVFNTRHTDFSAWLAFSTSTVNPNKAWDVHVRLRWTRINYKDVVKNRYHTFRLNGECKDLD